MRVNSPKFSMLENDNNDSRLEIYPGLFRILKLNSVCIIFCSWKNIVVDYMVLDKLFDIKNVIVWNKGGGGLGDLDYTLLTDYELAIVCHKGNRKINGKRRGSVFNYNKVNPNKQIHATQKPLELIKELINIYSDENDIILDCFSGSGTTCVAAKQLNRQFIRNRNRPRIS